MADENRRRYEKHFRGEPSGPESLNFAIPHAATLLSVCFNRFNAEELCGRLRSERAWVPGVAPECPSMLAASKSLFPKGRG